MQLWNSFSLRTRLFLPLGAMFVAAMVVGAMLLSAFATGQLIAESEPESRSAQSVAAALNAALRSSAEPEQILRAFEAGLGSNSSIQFVRGEAASGRSPPPRAARKYVPEWFVTLLGAPEVGARYPIMIGNAHAGDIVFAPDLSVDLYEKWVGFVAIAIAAPALALLSGLIAFAATDATLKPLRDLGAGLTRMRQGDYDTRIPERGPPEIRRSCQEANALAEALRGLSDDNKALLRKLVSLQDDERRDLARELHDELGPLLFGVRASAIALIDAPPADGQRSEQATDDLMRAVASVQTATRRILEHLRPLHIQELGLQNSLIALLTGANQQVPELIVRADLAAAIDGVDPTLAQTAYRVIQEAVTNVLRHANASALEARVHLIEHTGLDVEVSDNGSGFAPSVAFGRGLTGMRERVRALGGSFQLVRDGGWTRVRCHLPLPTRAK